MYAGRSWRRARPGRLPAPRHPYTRDSCARPSRSTTGSALHPGRAARPRRPPSGCRFDPAAPTRCASARRRPRSSRRRPPARRCWLHGPRARSRRRGQATGAPRDRRRRRSVIGAPAQPPLLEVRGLQHAFALRGSFVDRLRGREAGSVKARRRRDFDLRRGEVLGLVGECGSGKTTLGRALLGLAQPTGGSDPARRQRDHRLERAPAPAAARRMQMVFQDPHASLNPAMTIGDAVAHPLRFHGLASDAERTRTRGPRLERVGLAPAEQFLDKYPSDLSGGQKQRAVLARAIILGPDAAGRRRAGVHARHERAGQDPRADAGLKTELGLTYVYITHDLATAKFFCDRIAIMYLGRIVEIGPTAEIYANPRTPTPSRCCGDPRAGPAAQRAARPAARRGPRRCGAAARLLVPSAMPGRLRPLRLGEPRPPRALETRWTRKPEPEFEADASWSATSTARGGRPPSAWFRRGQAIRATTSRASSARFAPKLRTTRSGRESRASRSSATACACASARGWCPAISTTPTAGALPPLRRRGDGARQVDR